MGTLVIKRPSLTIFPKLVIALLMVIAPLYGVGLGMNKLGESSVRDELSTSLKSRVDFYFQSLEVENEHLISLLQQYVVDKDLQHLAFLSNVMTLTEWAETVTQIQNKLQLIKSASIYVKSVSAHIATLGRTLSTEKTISDTLDDDYQTVQAVYKQRGPGIFYGGKRLFIAIAYPGSDLPGMKETFVLSIELNLETMQQALHSFFGQEQSGAAIVHLEQNWAVTDSGNGDTASGLKPFLQSRYEQQTLEGVETLQTAGSSYMTAYKYSSLFGYYLIAYVPPEKMLGPLAKYRNLLYLLSFLSFFIVIVHSYWIYRLIHKPLQRMISGFRKVEAGVMEPIPLPRPNDEFLYLFQRFNMMTEKLRVLIHEVYEQKIRAQSAELKQLQSQINPHFLYNTYFILYRLAKMNDNDSVVRFSQHLGEYFQYITRNAAEEVTLEAEIKHSRTYAEIQNIRFAKSRISVDFAELPEAYGAMMVPRLIIQPLLENAYKYGLEEKRRNGRIVVAMERQGDELVISVDDNGDKLTDDDLRRLEANLASTGKDMEYTGLLNVHRRLQIRFGPAYGVAVSRSALGGMRVTLRFPCETAPPDSHNE